MRFATYSSEASKSSGGRQHLARDHARRRPGAPGARDAAAIAASRSRVAEQRVDLGRAAAAASARRPGGSSPRRPPPSSARWRSGGRRTRADTGSGSAGSPYWASSNTEPPARATARSAAASALPERRDVLAQVVVLAGRSQLGEVARAGRRAGRGSGGVGERLDGGEVDRARAERAAEDQHARRLRRDAELGARAAARSSTRRRDGAAGDEVAVAVAARRSGRRGRRGGRAARAGGWSGRGASRPRSARAGCAW